MALNLNFSVEGEFITNMARDKLINQHDLIGAIKLLDSALVTDQLNELEKMGLMFKILQGSLSIVGTYPGDDYGVDETPENKEILASAVSKQGQKIKDLEETNERLMNQLEIMEPLIPKPIKKEINNACGETVFDIDDTAKQIERDLTGVLNETDYGWLSPTGIFTPVPFGEHERFALDYLTTHTNKTERMDIIRRYHSRMTDWLIYDMHFILLHNPSLGPAIITRNEMYPMSKSQCDFLFEYLMERGRETEASALVD